MPAINDSKLRVVDSADTRSFLDATESWDHSFMNFCLGTVHLYARKADAQTQEAQNVHLHMLYRADELLIAMTRMPSDFAWVMGIPSTAVEAFERDAGLLASATTVLAQTLLAKLPDPLNLDKIIGPKVAVESLYSTYCSLLSQRGIRVNLDYGKFNVNDCYMTRASLPPLPAAPRGSPFTVVPATTDDLEVVGLLYIGFQLDTPWKAVVSRQQALTVVTQPVSDGLVWVCHVDGVVVGYVMLGRVTARTIAVRNVYVAKEHRRKGIAEAMMQTVTRYCLGVPVAGPEGVPDGPPPYGWKEQVSLNVEDLGAARIYKRVGFLLPDLEGGVPTGGVDPVTGRRGWNPSVCWGIQEQKTVVSN
ncbi:hypothetical protein C8Q80DRAFT_178453 [Daedaleopsis nitida]|nr:hypothetical protein C8Q80DRAFT_178453 [Daedaleopsis nitida]